MWVWVKYLTLNYTICQPTDTSCFIYFFFDLCFFLLNIYSIVLYVNVKNTSHALQCKALQTLLAMQSIIYASGVTRE